MSSFAVLLFPFLTLPASAQATASSTSFAALADSYWAEQMRLSPLYATYLNHPGAHDKLDDNSPEGRAEDLRVAQHFRARLAALDRTPLDEEERVSAQVLQELLDLRVEWHEHRFWQFDVDHMDGPQSWIPSVVEQAQPLRTREDLSALLRRVHALPLYYERHVANLREGLAAGRTAAAVAVEKTSRQLAELAAEDPEKSAFTLACARAPKDLRPDCKREVSAAVAGQAQPALRSYLAFLRDEYLPKARRDAVGLSALPGGDAAYRYQIRSHTTLPLDPADLHRIGLEEVASLRKEMEAVALKLGHKGELKDFLAGMKEDPKNFFKTRREIVKEAERLVAKITAKLPEAFGTLPKTPLVVKAVEPYKEKNETAARYYQPPDDLSRPGIYYINTYEPRTRARYAMTSLAAHEGVPGHHLQIALAGERRGLPAFRRQAGFSAFVEGWALYSERLVDELGLYEDDLSRVGMLADQSWRACRLVVDTGIHSLGWTRRQAVDFMMENTARSVPEIETEVDRYIIWPGQALAYKVGQREIAALRAEAAQRPGFDLKKFHDEVLKHGALPLPVLRKLVLPEPR